MSDNVKRKRSLSGIQPTNTPHLGNYLGAMRNWVNMQDEFESVYFIADLHAVTVKQNPSQLKKQTLESYTLLLAMGIDTEKSIVYVQSQVPANSELSWLLMCHTPFGELSRMTQFKDKSEKYPENINAGLFGYPVLQAADILAYQADVVPVGADQKQHIELTRNIAQRFNSIYGDLFVVPEPYIMKSTAKIMSLQEPVKKMSKSDENLNSIITVLDNRDVVIKKFKRAVTDSEAVVEYRENDESKAGINNLISIYSTVTGKTVLEIQNEFEGKGYGDFKLAVGESVADALKPLQERYRSLESDKSYVADCMKQGAEKAYRISDRTLKKVQKKIGFLQV